MKLVMKAQCSPGMLITLCGLDGCGKTTLINRLRAWREELEVPVTITKQPSAAVRTSPIFRTFMDSPDHAQFDYRALSLFCASDRIQHCSHVIQPLLEEGRTVISDRYFYSCLANLRARGYEDDRWIYDVARDIPRPDAAFFLDVGAEEAVRRVRSRESERDRYIDMELERRLRREYREIAQENGGILIPTDRSEEECFSLIRQAVLEVMRRV